MKKIFYMLCLLYLQNGYAMQGLLATVIATTPVTVPGTYHYFKTKQLQKELSPGDDKNELIAHDTYRPFVSGVIQGVVPPYNVISTVTYGPSLLFADLEKWEKREKMFLENNREKARAVGFVAGLSLYATVPLALRYVRR